jgi:glycosyltransferase involved in cell wall biosynthesis
MHGFPPEYMAGSEVYSLHLAKELNKNHEVIVFHRIENPFLEEYQVTESNFEGLKKFMVNIPYLPHYFEGRYINQKVEVIYEELLMELKPDIVHFGHLNYLSTNLVKITKSLNLPVIFTLHDFWLYCPRGQLINRRDESLCYDIDYNKCVDCLDEYLALEKDAINKIKQRREHIQKQVISHVDCFISPSKFLQNKMIELGVPKEKTCYLDYGFNFEFLKGFKKKKSETIRFGYIGRIIPTKGIQLLIQAFNKIKNNNSELRIYGSTSHLSYLEEMATNPNIHFLGGYDNWKIADVLAEIDVLIVPSIWFENSPLVIHEAAMAKIPIITTDLGGMAEYVKDNINGLLFKRNDVNDLVSKIKQFIDNPNLIEKLSKNPTHVVPIEEHSEKVIEIYQQFLGEK